MLDKLTSFEMPKRLLRDDATATDTYAKFVAEPFERGFGYTIGNSLRRVLLSSLEGAAIVAVRIDGVQHEFSCLPGMVEDVTELILNLKGVHLRTISGEPRSIRLKVHREGKVTAADIETEGTVEIVNPDHYICTLSKKVKLKMEIEVAVGRGYRRSERLKRTEQPIGVILMDAIFSPVTKVRYNVENTRVGQITDYDRMIIEIWTDGRLTPTDALRQSAAILRDHLHVFVDYDERYIDLIEDEEKKEDKRESLKRLLQMSINEIELSVRAANCIQSADIKTIGELVQKTEQEMLKYRNFGKKSLSEIKNILEGMGLHLGMEIPEGILTEPASLESAGPEDGEGVEPEE